MEYKDYKTCQKCAGSYILFNNRCISPNARSYSPCAIGNDEGACDLCIQGYFNREGECIEVEPIVNCKFYSTTMNYTKCWICEDGFYVDENTNRCEKRVDSVFIEFCAKKSWNEDICEECDEFFVLTHDTLKCLPEILDCIEYESSSVFSQKMNCKQCKIGMFFNALINFCESGTKENCEVYKDYSNECLICKNEFYLNYE